MNEFTDDDLIRQFKVKETKNHAFKLIVEQYQKKLYWHIRKMIIDHDDTDDVLQNTFIKAWKGLDNFRSESKLFTWLYRIATNETLTFIENRKKRNLIPIDEPDSHIIYTLESDPYFNGDETQLKLQQALLTLPEKQRIVFNMKYFDEIQYDEMSEILNTSVGALKASYHHAVKKIEKFFEIN